MAETDWNSWFENLASELDADRDTQLVQAKQEAAARGKEPFDLDRLEALYQPVPDPYYKPSREERHESYERRYYTDYREVMTLEEFAIALRRSELFDGGDLGRDDEL